MPTYDFQCAECGPFRVVRPMSDYKAPASCPACGELAARKITAPNFNSMSSAARKAHQINERSADEPRVASRAQLEQHRRHSVPVPGSGGCCHGHGHGHDHTHGKPKGQPRPWTIGH